MDILILQYIIRTLLSYRIYFPKAVLSLPGEKQISQDLTTDEVVRNQPARKRLTLS